jgi:hypothetical protein
MTASGDRINAGFERWYLPFLLTLWCIAPGIRRLIDWQVGRTPLSIVSILPLLALLPLLYVVGRKFSSSRIGLPFKTLMYFWLFGFVYALVVALAGGGQMGAIYDFAIFCLPMLVGAWVIVRPASREATFETLTRTLLWLGVFESVYGIYQYVAPLPWDVAYVNNANQVSLGVPEPYGLHPFSTLNSPGTLSLFLAVVILLNLHRLALRRPLPLIAIVGCVATLVLTNVRSAWLAVAVGVVAYLVLSPKRAKAFGALAAVGLVSVVLLLNASTLLGNATITQSLQSRFDSLGNVDEDESVSARRAESNFAMHQGLEEPLGQGLGTVGGAVKLGDTGAGQLVLDNGYLSRFLEMGVAGFICYVATLAGGVIFGVRALVLGFTTRNPGLQQLAVTSVTVQCALAGLDLSSDYHSGLPGMFFWIALGLALRFEPGDDGRQKAWESVPTRSRGANGPLWA